MPICRFQKFPNYLKLNLKYEFRREIIEILRYDRSSPRLPVCIRQPENVRLEALPELYISSGLYVNTRVKRRDEVRLILALFSPHFTHIPY